MPLRKWQLYFGKCVASGVATPLYYVLPDPPSGSFGIQDRKGSRLQIYSITAATSPQVAAPVFKWRHQRSDDNSNMLRVTTPLYCVLPDALVWQQLFYPLLV